LADMGIVFQKLVDLVLCGIVHDVRGKRLVQNLNG
jgi:hypothetical protein